MVESKIKRCPFCDGESEVYKNRVWRYNVRCTSCGMGQTSFTYETPEDAIAKWNNRKPMDELEYNLTRLFQQRRSSKILRKSIWELVKKAGGTDERN